ncbi:disulfide bond formation protein DsbC [Asticcacaulis sp. AC460]|uniref:DsbC family protein n=1 Tax=Asticcacaulis sp. AC460 TaxID=1282360 RepID=UPI0003C3BFC6|nr:DsbC family protein [Asticcacaulis sp. AC460]ESQ87960.1 disulfide bond formation protein DsbC [Asticcacaulis sp. AC460]
MIPAWTKTKLNRETLGIIGLFGAAAIAVVVAGVLFLPQNATSLQTRIQADFPNTRITSINCDTAVDGLCEVTAGKNLFYATRDGRFIVVGSLIDLQKKLDLTDERLKQLAALDLATDKVTSAPAKGTAPQVPALAKLDVDLPLANAVIHNPGAPIKIKVFSDFSCGYCRMLFAELSTTKGIEVTEYPIAILGEESATKARIVLCAKDRPAASIKAYTSGKIETGSDCAAAAAAVEANTRFAQAHGVSGTPTIIRADGTVNQGYLALDALKAFGEAKS